MTTKNFSKELLTSLVYGEENVGFVVVEDILEEVTRYGEEIHSFVIFESETLSYWAGDYLLHEDCEPFEDSADGDEVELRMVTPVMVSVTKYETV